MSFAHALLQSALTNINQSICQPQSYTMKTTELWWHHEQRFRMSAMFLTVTEPQRECYIDTYKSRDESYRVLSDIE